MLLAGRPKLELLVVISVLPFLACMRTPCTRSGLVADQVEAFLHGFGPVGLSDDKVGLQGREGKVKAQRWVIVSGDLGKPFLLSCSFRLSFQLHSHQLLERIREHFN